MICFTTIHRIKYRKEIAKGVIKGLHIDRYGLQIPSLVGVGSPGFGVGIWYCPVIAFIFKVGTGVGTLNGPGPIVAPVQNWAKQQESRGSVITEHPTGIFESSGAHL